MRFLFYSHDGMGLGHTRRHLRVAAALAEQAPDSAILLATGAEDGDRQGLPRQVEILKLPGLRKDANEKYASRRLHVSVEQIRKLRSAILLSAVRAFEPEVVLVDKHPFGASGEFKAGLKALRRAGGSAVLGLRDILDDPAHVLSEWKRVHHQIAAFYQRVLVYGQKAVYDPTSAYEFPPALSQRTQFCGYVFAKENTSASENPELLFPAHGNGKRPVVLASAGGGEDGFRVLSTFIRSAKGASWDGVVVAGPMMPDAELAVLEQLAADNGVALRHHIPQLSALFSSVAAVVCMGGYNTLVEAAAAGVPTVCVPRVEPRVEQLMRAEAFERLGLLSVCHPRQLEPASLRAKIEAALRMPREVLLDRARGTLDFNGAQQAAQCLIRLARSHHERSLNRPAATAPRRTPFRSNVAT